MNKDKIEEVEEEILLSNLNENLDKYRVALTQSAKGFFYLHKVEVLGSDMEQIKKDLDNLSAIAVAKCNALNIARQEVDKDKQS